MSDKWVFSESEGSGQCPGKIRDCGEIINPRTSVLRQVPSLQSGAGHLLEFESMLDIAEVITLGALNRQETRGSHYRPDYH